MQCDEARSRIEERQDGLLSESDAAAFDAHVRLCAACTLELAEATAFEALLESAADPRREDGAVQRLSLALESSRGERRPRWLALAAVAAAIVVALLVLRPWEPSLRELPRGEIVQLAKGSQARVGRARVHALTASRLETSAHAQTVIMRAGSIRFRVDPETTPFSVETPAGSVRVLGTEFEVRVMQKKQWIGAGIVTTVLVASGLVLLENDAGEVRAPAGSVAVMRAGHAPQLLDSEAVASLLEDNERLRAEVEALRETAGTGGPTLKPATSPTASDSPSESRDAPKGAEAAADPKPTSATDGTPTSVTDTDWDRLGKALLFMLEGDEVEKQDPSPESVVERAYAMSRLAAMAHELKRRMGPEVLLDERVRRRFLGGLFRAALPGKDAKEQEAIIDTLTKALASNETTDDSERMPMEQMATKLSAGLRAARAVEGDLSASENIVVLRLLTLLQQGFGQSISTSVGGSVEDLASSVARSLVERMTIGEDDRAALKGPTLRFAEAHRRARTELATKYGVDAHDLVLKGKGGADALERLGEDGFRRARLVAWERFARVQAAMEREIHDDMPAAVQERLRASREPYWYMVRLSDD